MLGAIVCFQLGFEEIDEILFVLELNLFLFDLLLERGNGGFFLDEELRVFELFLC